MSTLDMHNRLAAPRRDVGWSSAQGGRFGLMRHISDQEPYTRLGQLVLSYHELSCFILVNTTERAVTWDKSLKNGKARSLEGLQRRLRNEHDGHRQ